jgi:hypothetical protein
MKAREAYATPLISGGSMLRLHSLLARRLMLVAWLIPWITTASMYDPRRNNTTVRWRPLGKGVLLRPDVPTCEKCIYEACPYWDCLDQITVEEVRLCIDEVVGRSVWYQSSSHALNA